MDLAGTLLVTVKKAVCQQTRPEGYNLILKAIVYHAIICEKESWKKKLKKKNTITKYYIKI